MYGEKGEIFYSRSLAYEGFEQGNGDVLCGHEGEVSRNAEKALVELGFPAELLSYTDGLVAQNEQYRRSIIEKAENHTYSLIALEPDTDTLLIDGKASERFGYRFLDDLTLQLGNMPYEVLFYAVN